MDKMPVPRQDWWIAFGMFLFGISWFIGMAIGWGVVNLDPETLFIAIGLTPLLFGTCALLLRGPKR